MSSVAFLEWETGRRARLQELYAAHAVVGGQGPGRRTATEQINWSLALRLAGEFRGFMRDLHDQASDVFVLRVYAMTSAHESAIANLLTLGRDLDKRNATPSTIQRDFSRLGFKMLDELKKRYVGAERWLIALEELNTARNGVAHSDRSKMADAAGGPTLQLLTVRRWDASLRALARASDRVAAESLAKLTRGGAPW